MVSELRKRKIGVLFRADDTNSDGFLDESDFTRIADSYRSIRGWSRDSEEGTRLHDAFDTLWNGLREAADADGDGKVSLEETFEGVDRVMSSNPAAADQFGRLVFATLDADGDGEISVDEYGQMLSTISADASVAAETFPRLDLNGDGKITQDELEDLFREFFLSEDPESPGNWLWGPF